MALIRPFRALRPPRDLAEKVAALPYDVMDVEEARSMAAGNPDSFLHISRPEIDLPPDVDPYDNRVHEKGRENLQDFVKRGVLLQDEKEYFYVYRQKTGTVSQTGLVVCASVDDYQKDIIRKHELTRADKEEDRVKHIESLDANDEPVFYLFRKKPVIEKLLATISEGEPEYDFTTDDGVSHTLWIVSEQEMIDRLVLLFSGIKNLYVADGHHRSAAASRVRELRKNMLFHDGTEEYNFFLTVIFPEGQLNILPYNRVVKDLNRKGIAEFMSLVGRHFDMTPSAEPVQPKSRHRFGMYLAGKWYHLNARPAIINESDTVSRLDVSILQDRLLNPVLGIRNPRTDKRIHFVGGIRGTEELMRLVDSGEYAVAFSLYPTSVSELVELADQGQIMPPKSTWFEPKLRSGLFVHLLS